MITLVGTLLIYSSLAVATNDADFFGAESQPYGEPIGGGTGYSDIYTSGDFNVSTKSELLSALSNAASGDVIFVSGSAAIDMTGETNLSIPSGVTLASNRGYNGAAGGKLYTSVHGGTNPEGFFYITASNVRITGLRLEGPEPDTELSGGMSVGVWVYNSSVEVDNCEIFSWGYAGVRVNTGTVSAYPYIHHNYIHNNQIAGYGYGVITTVNAAALIEGNYFDYSRHHIAGSGGPDCSYEACFNIFSKNCTAYAVDMHRNANNVGGKRIKIHHNSFYRRDPSWGSIHLEGVTADFAWIFNNWFIGTTTNSISQWPYAGSEQTIWSNFVNMAAFHDRYTDAEWGNINTEASNYRTADFNGDGELDVVYFEDTGSYWNFVVSLANTSLGFNTYSTWDYNGKITLDRFRVADVTGDGKDDIISLESNKNFYVWVSTGSDFNACTQWGTNAIGDIGQSRYKMADVNNDGKWDLISFESDKNFYVWTSTGSSFNSKALWGSNGADLGGDRYTVQDVTGDGRADVVSFESNKKSYVWKAKSTGDGFYSAAQWSANGTYYAPSRHKIADLDGDGKFDQLTMESTRVFRWLSTGSTFGSATLWFYWQ